MDNLDQASSCFENLRHNHTFFQEDCVSLSGTWRLLEIRTGEAVPEDIANPDFSDCSWETCALPLECPEQVYLHEDPIKEILFNSRKTDLQDELPLRHLFFRRNFQLPENWQLRTTLLRFDGIGASIRLWINGTYVGSSKISLSPIEFDITAYVHPEENSICIELQDNQEFYTHLQPHQWIKQGIFGEIQLYSLPHQRIDDLFVRSEFQPNGSAAALHVTLFTSNSEGLCAKIAIMEENQVLFYGEGTIEHNQLTVRIPCSGVTLWSCEQPVLYRIAVILSDGVGVYHTREICYGVRKLEMDCNGILLNSIPIKLYGINYRRNKTDPFTLRQDIELMRSCGINAIMVRSALPDRFYSLCDELGIYVIDSSCLRGSPVSMETAVCQLEEHLMLAHRNHPCILIWDILQQRDQIEQIDPSRPVIKDFFAIDEPNCEHLQMYLNHEDIDVRPSGLRRFLNSGSVISSNCYQNLPFLVTSFGKICGNGAIPTDEFVQQMRNHPQLCGIFLWNFTDQTCSGQWLKDCLTGLVSETGTPHGLIASVRKSYQRLTFTRYNSNITVHNFDSVRNLQDYTVICQLLLDGTEIERFQVALSARPQDAATFPVQFRHPMFHCGLYTLRISASIGETEEAWAAWKLLDLPPIREDSPGGSIRDEDGNVILRTEKTSYIINRSTGNLDQITVNGENLLTDPLTPEFCRPKTPLGGSQRQSDEWEKLTLKNKLPKPTMVEVDHMARSVSISQNVGSGLLRIYHLYSSGALELELRLRTSKTSPTRIGLSCGLPQRYCNFEWTGLGPYDTYPDRMEGGEYSNYCANVSQNQDLFPMIQEYGNKMEIHRLTLTDSSHSGIEIVCPEGLSASVRQWSLVQLCSTESVSSLPSSDRTFLNLDVVQNGLREEIIAPHTTYTYRFIISPIL